MSIFMFVISIFLFTILSSIATYLKFQQKAGKYFLGIALEVVVYIIALASLLYLFEQNSYILMFGTLIMYIDARVFSGNLDKTLKKDDTDGNS